MRPGPPERLERILARVAREQGHAPAADAAAVRREYSRASRESRGSMYRPGTWLTKRTGYIGDTSETQKRKWQQRKIPCMPWKESRIVDERIKFIADILGGDHNMTELCQIYNISRKTGYNGKPAISGSSGFRNLERLDWKSWTDDRKTVLMRHRTGS